MDAKEDWSADVAATAGQRRPVLIDIRTAQPLDADARHHYSGQTLDQARLKAERLELAAPRRRPGEGSAALDAGCDACVYKGFTIEEVFASIRILRK